MQNTNRYIILAGISIGCISILYFLSLVLHIPFILSVILISFTVFLLYKWIGFDNETTNNNSIQWKRWFYIVLAFGLFTIIKKTYLLAYNYGGWNAWAMWNYRAKYLADPHAWHKLLTLKVEDSHPDYPLCLPSFLGFVFRLSHLQYTVMIPFIFCIFIALSIPILIYIENAKRNLVIAAFSLFFFSQDVFYLSTAVSQYADTLVAFFFLCSFICINYADSNRKFITLTTALLGCCMWTKNEGILLAFLFTIFYSRTFFSKTNFKYAFAGFLLPLSTLLVFKFAYAPANDIVSSQGHNTLQLILSPERYTKIYDSLTSNLNQKFYYLKIGFYIYLLLCLLEKRIPGKQMFLLISCLLAYMFVYVVTPMDLDWHLSTSQDRIMHQLMPAMMYILADKFSKIKFALSV
jgi:hypothetical protein